MDKEELLRSIKQKQQEIRPTDTGEMKPATVPNNLELGWLNALKWMEDLIKSLPFEESSKQLCWNDMTEEEKSDFFFDLSHQKIKQLSEELKDLPSGDYKDGVIYVLEEELIPFINSLPAKQDKTKSTNFEVAESEKYSFVTGQFLECRASFNEFKEDNSYWLEYVGNDNYIGRSDNILNQKFHITPRQLFTLFTQEHCPKEEINIPTECGKYVDNCGECEVLSSEELEFLTTSLEETIGTSPHSRETILDYLKQAAQWQKEQTINKACEWLNENVVEYHPRTGKLRPIVNTNAFREAMDEQ